MSEAQTSAVVLTLIKRPVTSADFKANAEFYHAAAVKANEAYNVAAAAFNRAQELENVVAGTQITFNEGKGEKAEVLTGKVITRLDNGTYQVLVQYVGAPARLVIVKPVDIVHITVDTLGAGVEVPTEEVEAPAPTPEFDAQ